MNRFIRLFFLSLLLGVICETTIAATWSPPEAPDQIRNTPIEHLNRAVLRIKSTWIDMGDILHQESGTGIALGIRRGRLFVMTAAHVVRHVAHGSGTDIRVSLKDAPFQDYAATIIDYDAEKDFAVIATHFISSDMDRESIVKFPIDFKYAYAPGEFVKVIGHPGNKLWSKIDTKTKSSNSPVFMTMERASIGNGNSGGPVLSSFNQLIGMITSVKGADAKALKVGEIVRLLDGWGIPYRARFVTDYSSNFRTLSSAVYNNSADKLFENLIQDETYYAKFHRPRVALFNKDLALLVEETGGTSNEDYYVELFGYYGITGQQALDEAWRILVRSLSRFVPKGYTVRREGYSIDFSDFKIGKGRRHIRVIEHGRTLYVVIGKNLDKNVVTLGKEITPLHHTVTYYLENKRRELEEQ